MIYQDTKLAQLKEVAKEFGFRTINRNKNIKIRAKNTDGKYVNWMDYNATTDIFRIYGNTDYLNIWLSDTRPDLTSEMLVEFVKKINSILDLEDKLLLKDIIDPEDWQEIANIFYAYDDERYVKAA